MSEQQAPRNPSPLAGEAGRVSRRAPQRPGFGFDFAEEVSGRAAERTEARAEGLRMVAFLIAVVAGLTVYFVVHAVTAGLEPAAKREDRLTPSPLPKAFCTAPAAAGEAG